MAANITHANNTIKTRTQLKRDTEANWNKAGPKDNSPGFIPLEGELIVYLPDVTHDYSRLKVGDGETNVVALPFIDSGSVNGATITNEVVMFSGSTFPANGDSSVIYVNTTDHTIYLYDGTTYIKLSNYTYSATKGTASKINSWDAGRRATFSLLGGRFSILSGTAPTLSYLSSLFVQDIIKEGDGE